MGTELRVTLPGPDGAEDAWRAIAAIQHLLTVLGQVEDRELDKRTVKHEDRSRWGFTQLALGSLVATLAPSEPRRGATISTMVNALDITVSGFATAQQREGIPEGWNNTIASTGADLARLFSAIDAAGMRLEVIQDGQVVRDVVVTRAAEENLTAGLKVRRHSIGSAIGRLDSATLHRHREARIWLERTGESAIVTFAAGDIDVIRNAWGRRVEVRGVVERDLDGRITKIRLQDLEILAGSAESPPLTDLIGLDPGLTGGMDPSDYLREIRGAAN